MMALVAGYDNRREDSWQQTRILAYVMMCTVTEEEKRPSLYKFMPLKGDPTEAELQQKDQAKYDELLKLQKEMTAQVREEMKRINKRKGKG